MHAAAFLLLTPLFADFNRKAKVPVSGLDEQGLEKKVRSSRLLFAHGLHKLTSCLVQFAEIVEVGMQMPKAEEVRISELPTMVE